MENNLLKSGISSDLLGFVFNLDLLKDLNDIPRENIHELLNKTLLVGGKRLRPLLTFLVGDFFGVNRETVTPYAKAIELVHAASLSHDDVVDNATTRRGFPSINIQSSNKKAVLTGDYLLSQVIVRLCKEGNFELVSLLSNVIQDLALGEWLQEDNRKREHLEWAHIEDVAKNKTSSVISFCTQVAPILSGANESVVQSMKRLGVSLGLAFQYVDDVIDFSPANISGKGSKIDLENGIVNSVMFEFFKLQKDLFLSWKSSMSQFVEVFNENNYHLDFSLAKKIVFEKALNEILVAKKELFFVRSYLETQNGGVLTPGQDESYNSLCFLMDYLVNREF